MIAQYLSRQLLGTSVDAGGHQVSEAEIVPLWQDECFWFGNLLQEPDIEARNFSIETRHERNT